MPPLPPQVKTATGTLDAPLDAVQSCLVASTAHLSGFGGLLLGMSRSLGGTALPSTIPPVCECAHMRPLSVPLTVSGGIRAVNARREDLPARVLGRRDPVTDLGVHQSGSGCASGSGSTRAT